MNTILTIVPSIFQLFGSRREAGGATAPPGGIQQRELQHSLELERHRNAELRQQIMKLRDELHQAKTESKGGGIYRGIPPKDHPRNTAVPLLNTL